MPGLARSPDWCRRGSGPDSRGGRLAARRPGSAGTAGRDALGCPARPKLAELAATTPGSPSVLVSASAIGYYGPGRGDELLTEDSPRGAGFLADMVAGWEAASDPARAGGIRVAQIRTGIVQSPRGGTLRLLRPLAEVGAAGRLGTGQQWCGVSGVMRRPGA